MISNILYLAIFWQFKIDAERQPYLYQNWYESRTFKRYLVFEIETKKLLSS